MPTLMEFIVAQSTLPVGNTIRDHIENPLTGGGGLSIVMEVEAEIVDLCFDAEIDTGDYDAEVDDVIYEAEIDDEELEAEIC